MFVSTHLFLSRACPITILLDNLDSPYCLEIIPLYWTFYIILVTTDINCIIMYDFLLSRMFTEICVLENNGLAHGLSTNMMGIPSQLTSK